MSEPILNNNELVADAYVTQFLELEQTEAPVLLAGYLGQVGSSDRWRLYTTLDLDVYVEFDASASVLHLSGMVGPVNGTYLWLDSDAEVTFHDGHIDHVVTARILKPEPAYAW